MVAGSAAAASVAAARSVREIVPPPRTVRDRGSFAVVFAALAVATAAVVVWLVLQGWQASMARGEVPKPSRQY